MRSSPRLPSSLPPPLLPRRLAPNFKVRVEVKYSGAVSLPLTLRAFLLSQQDKDNVLAWQPDDGSDDKAVQVGGRRLPAGRPACRVALAGLMCAPAVGSDGVRRWVASRGWPGVRQHCGDTRTTCATTWQVMWVARRLGKGRRHEPPTPTAMAAG